ncbi:MAG: 1-deoxy-D-xylulose-5-phosphate synthase [Muribaculaceae bacterium]
MYIEQIKSPADVKQLTIAQMEAMAQEMRTLLIDKLSEHGGHCGPNLGMVEATIALHYVFNSPIDKIVFDVSHQSYAHKMLTGRGEAFVSSEHYGDVSGYTDPNESPHDHFTIGHTSTSVSLACGLAKGRDLQGQKSNIIAVIGDGSLSGGEALEALDWASELNTNLIIVVNDNQMSIAENHGGLYRNLEELRQSNGTCSNNLFRAMSLDYVYEANGNNIASLIEIFKKVKDIDHPVVVHINTVKGKGYELAEKDKERWHWSAPFDKATGELKHNCSDEDYNSLTATHLLELMKHDSTICAITAGTPGIWGWTPENRRQAGSQFVDVGIAEEHAVALASGIAKAGGKPVFGVCSSFIQRAYDQLSQDLCINNNPATILVLWGSLSSMTDVTHLCHFDIPLISNIPNMVYLAPTNRDEYLAMLNWSISYTEHPVAIRVPVGLTKPANRKVDTDYSALNRYEMVHKGSQVAVLALGNFFELGEKVCSQLAEHGIDATLINPRYISGIDTQMLNALSSDHSVVVTLEDGALEGGFGEKIARYLGPSPLKTLCYGAKKQFADRYNPAEYLAQNRLVDNLIAQDVINCINNL